MTLQMKKTHFYLLIGFIAVLIIGVSGVFLFKDSLFPQSSTTLTEVPVDGLPTQLPIPEVKMISFEDPLGFSFSYPEKFVLDKHQNDQVNYANLELLNGEENFKILLSDPPSSDLAVVIKQDNELSDGSILDSKVDNLEVKKIFVPKTNKTVYLGLWDGMLLKIQYLPSNKKEFSQLAEKIIASLQFPETANYTDATTQTQTTAPAVSEDVMVDEDSSIEEIE